MENRSCNPLIAAVFFIIFILILGGIIVELKAIGTCRTEISTLKVQADEQKKVIEQQGIMIGKGICTIMQQEQELKAQVDKLATAPDLEEESLPDRGAAERNIPPISMLVTAYDLSYESCGKHPEDPAYGITASGQPVKDWYTAAGCPMLPFGTIVYIPSLFDYPNHGIFIIEDRGSAIVDSDPIYGLPCLDIFIRDHKTMDRFGGQVLEAYILKWGESGG